MGSKRSKNKNRVIPLDKKGYYRLVKGNILAKRARKGRYKLYSVDSQTSNRDIVDFFQELVKTRITTYSCAVLMSYILYVISGNFEIDNLIVRAFLSIILGVSLTSVALRMLDVKLSDLENSLGLRRDYYLLVDDIYLESVNELVADKMNKENHRLDVTDLVRE